MVPFIPGPRVEKTSFAYSRLDAAIIRRKWVVGMSRRTHDAGNRLMGHSFCHASGRGGGTRPADLPTAIGIVAPRRRRVSARGAVGEVSRGRHPRGGLLSSKGLKFDATPARQKLFPESLLLFLSGILFPTACDVWTFELLLGLWSEYKFTRPKRGGFVFYVFRFLEDILLFAVDT